MSRSRRVALVAAVALDMMESSWPAEYHTTRYDTVAGIHPGSCYIPDSRDPQPQEI